MTQYNTQDVQKVTRTMGGIILALVILVGVFAFANWSMATRLEAQAYKIEQLESDLDRVYKEKDAFEAENLNLKENTIITQSQLTELEALREFYFRTTGKQIAEVKEVTFEATRYTNSEGWWSKGDPNYGMTASGVFTSHGTIAAPKSVPFGSTVMLTDESLDESSEIFTVEDRGGAIKMRDSGEICIDIWTPESKINQAFAFGRKKVQGYLIIPEEDI